MSEAAMSNEAECAWAIRVGEDRWEPSRGFPDPWTSDWRSRGRWHSRADAVEQLRSMRRWWPDKDFTLVRIARRVKPKVLRESVRWEVRGVIHHGQEAPAVVLGTSASAHTFKRERGGRVVKVTRRVLGRVKS